MLKKLYQKNKTGILHFAKFQVVGVINFFVDYGVLSLLNLALGVPVVIANTISYSCGVINSFVLNRYWTFKIRHRFFSVYTVRLGERAIHIRFFSVHFLRFIFVNLISLGVNTLAVYILADLYSLPNIAAKIIAAAFSFTINFAGNKLLVFRAENGKTPSPDCGHDGSQ